MVGAAAQLGPPSPSHPEQPGCPMPLPLSPCPQSIRAVTQRGAAGSQGLTPSCCPHTQPGVAEAPSRGGAPQGAGLSPPSSSFGDIFDPFLTLSPIRHSPAPRCAVGTVAPEPQKCLGTPKSDVSPGGISSSTAPFPWENPNPTAPSPQDAWTHSSPCPMGILRCLVPGLSPAQPLGEVRPIWGFFALPNIQAAKNLGELISLSPLRALGAP